jgi:hypothetical protein
MVALAAENVIDTLHGHDAIMGHFHQAQNSRLALAMMRSSFSRRASDSSYV